MSDSVSLRFLIFVLGVWEVFGDGRMMIISRGKGVGAGGCGVWGVGNVWDGGLGLTGWKEGRKEWRERG